MIMKKIFGLCILFTALSVCFLSIKPVHASVCICQNDNPAVAEPWCIGTADPVTCCLSCKFHNYTLNVSQTVINDIFQNCPASNLETRFLPTPQQLAIRPQPECEALAVPPAGEEEAEAPGAPATCLCTIGEGEECFAKGAETCDRMSVLKSGNCRETPCIVGEAQTLINPGSCMCTIEADKTEECVPKSQPSCSDLSIGLVRECVESGCHVGEKETLVEPTKPAKKEPKTVNLENPIGSTDIATIIGTLIKGAMGIMGALVLLMFVWGGFTWLTSAGKAERVKSGTQTMVWAVIGAVVTLSSYVILNTVLNLLAGGSP